MTDARRNRERGWWVGEGMNRFVRSAAALALAAVIATTASAELKGGAKAPLFTTRAALAVHANADYRDHVARTLAAVRMLGK